MAISEVIKFGGAPDDLVWKYGGEEFNATSQLIVDETHQALLVINGQAADLFESGSHTLSVPNIPLLKRIINIPTNGVSPFTCKVFYVSKIHQMDMLWGTVGDIVLEDPIYSILLHNKLRGSMTYSIVDTRKFLLKLVGFKNVFKPNELVQNFRGIINAHVKDCVSKIMINGKLSYFVINANLFDISMAVKERLDDIFDEYGIKIEFFNIESIEVPDDDLAYISAAKERNAARLIEGYTWEDERKMVIMEKFASNEGSMGQSGGLIAGLAMGGLMGGSILDIARDALTLDNSKNSSTSGFDVNAFLNNTNKSNPETQTPVDKFEENTDDSNTKMKNDNDSSVCESCGATLNPGAKFCSECGARQIQNLICPDCGTKLNPGAKFCFECGKQL